MDKETYSFMYPSGIASFSFRFSDRAMRWLCGTTTDDNGRETGNFTLFGDLLAKMALTDGSSQRLPQTAHAFRRSGAVFRGTAFFARDMGRKRIRNLLATLTDMGLSTLAVQGWHP